MNDPRIYIYIYIRVYTRYIWYTKIKYMISLITYMKTVQLYIFRFLYSKFTVLALVFANRVHTRRLQSTKRQRRQITKLT